MAGFGGINQSNFMKPRKPATSTKTTVKKPFSTVDNDRTRFLEANQADPLTRLIQSATGSTGGTGGFDYTTASNLNELKRQMAATTRTAATGGGGTGTGTGGGTAGISKTEPGQGDKYDGFAGRYVPGERDLLFSNPGIIVQDWLAQGPYRNNAAMAGDLQRYADIVFGSGNQPGLYELLLGGDMGKNGANAADDKQINYLADLLTQQSTVGGRSPSIQQMVNMLYSMFDNPDSTLNTALGTGGTDPAGTQETINQVLSFIPLLGEFTGNQRFARLLGQQAQNIAQDYMRQTANGKAKGSFMDFFRNNFLT